MSVGRLGEADREPTDRMLGLVPATGAPDRGADDDPEPDEDPAGAEKEAADGTAAYGPSVGPDGPGYDTDAGEGSTLALFEGDEGGLDVAQRRVLVVLLKQRFISNRTHPKEWSALVANPRPVRARLNDLFLELVLDPEREVAYKRQVAPEGGGRPFPTLLYDTPWGREETLALVYLRTRHRNDQAAGAARSFADRADILEYVAQHRPGHATDRSGDARKAANAVDSLYRTGLLLGPSTGDRFEISDAIEVLLPLEKLTGLLAWMREQNAQGGDSQAPTPVPSGPTKGHDDARDKDDEPAGRDGES